MAELYDSIAEAYLQFRQPDRRIQRAICSRLDGIASVVNVGAGTGSYEPRDRFVVAVEASMIMIRQRSAAAAPAVQGVAEDLPFEDAAFDGSTAILTAHHWTDWHRGVRELARVSRRRVVLLTWDPSAAGFWLVNDYFPGLLEVDRRIFPSIDGLASELGRTRVEPVEIPHDCSDGFLGAYWRRPHEYLRPAVRQAISTFSRLPDADVGLARLRRDLQSGEWHRRHGDLLSRDRLDLGYRLVSTV